MKKSELGRLYKNREVVVRKGDPGDCMYIVQKGRLGVYLNVGDEKPVATFKSGDFFGEMSLFTGEPRSATIMSIGECRVLTIDKQAFMQRVNEDPALVFRIQIRLIQRIQNLKNLGVDG